MSYYAGDDPDVPKPWFLRKTNWIIAAIFFSLLALGVLIFISVGIKRIPEIGGGVTIEADPDTKIYVGENWLGTTRVSFTWEELFGDQWHNPIAVELADPAALVTAEMVSGPGAKILDSQGGGGAGSSLGGIMVSGTCSKYIIRRAEGDLDQVMALVIDWAPPNEPVRRYMLPVRLRKGAGESTVYFDEAGTSSSSGSGPGFVKAFGQSPVEIKKSWKFSAGTPPHKFAEEIKTKGLWEPRGNK
jgi:hypothetical protein